MSRLLVSLLACGVALFLVGCHDNYKMPPPVTNPNFGFTLLVSPQPIRQMDPSLVTVKLVNAKGKPVADAAVRVDLAMPSMDMGTNRISLTQKARGTYNGTVRFPMDGDWRVTVTAAKGQRKAVQTYPVTVR